MVNVKVGGPDGSVDPSQIIAALDWVAAHHSDPGVNIRVVNLSYGSESTQSYLTDPVAAAVERVWKAGVVVDVAAGNSGEQNSLLTDPAIDPYVIAVGANGSYGANGQKLSSPRSPTRGTTGATWTSSARGARSCRCATRARMSMFSTLRASCPWTPPAGTSADRARPRPPP